MLDFPTLHDLRMAPRDLAMTTNLMLDAVVQTDGYHSPGDGGGATYVIEQKVSYEV